MTPEGKLLEVVSEMRELSETCEAKGTNLHETVEGLTTLLVEAVIEYVAACEFNHVELSHDSG